MDKHSDAGKQRAAAVLATDEIAEKREFKKKVSIPLLSICESDTKEEQKRDDQDKIDQLVRETSTELETDDAAFVGEKTEKQLALKKEESIDMGRQNIKIASKESDEEDNLDLGCVQGMFERLFKIPQRRSRNCALIIGILLIISDASGDYGLAFLMYKRGFIKEALLILASECLASLLAILHITRTWIRSQDSWQKILRETLFLLIFSPVMVIVTTVFWFINRTCNPTVQDNRYHFYAKTSSVLHGTVEAPMQIVLMLSFIIKGQVCEKKIISKFELNIVFLVDLSVEYKGCLVR